MNRLISTRPVGPEQPPRGPQRLDHSRHQRGHRQRKYAVPSHWRHHEMRRAHELLAPTCHHRSARDLARLADILLVAGWTGLRWSELREVRVSDVVEVPIPAIYVRRAAPEGGEAKRTKSGKSRMVPLADRILPVVRDMMTGRTSRDLLFVTATGHRLHVSAVRRAVDWALMPMAVAFTTSDTQLPACGCPRGSQRPPFRPGCATPRSRRPTSTCTTSGRSQTGPDWTS
jgi:integrase